MNFKLRFLTILLGAMCASVGGYAQSSVYSLEAALEKGRKENLALLSSRYGTELYQERVREVRNGFLPKINLIGDYKYYLDIPTQVAPASAFGGEGGYVPLQFGVPHQSSVTASVQQILFNPSLSVGIKAARTGEQLSALQLRQAEEDVVYNITSVYYNAQNLHQQKRMLQENAESLERLIGTTQLLKDNDLAKGTDVKRLQLNHASLMAEIQNIEVAYNQLINLLKLLTNTPTAEPFAIDTVVSTEFLLVQTATDGGQRADLQLVQKQLEVQVLEEKEIQARYLPTLAAVGVYGQTGFGSFSDDFYEFYPLSYVGVQLSMPVFDGLSKRSQRAQKQIEQKQTQAQLAQLRQAVDNDMANAQAKLQTQMVVVANQQRALQLAKEVYDNVLMQYREGLVAVRDVLDSEQDLRTAQTDYLNAWIQVRLAELERQKAAGTLLE